MSTFALGDKQGKIAAKFLASLHFPHYLLPQSKLVTSQQRKSEINVVETHTFTYVSKTFHPCQYTQFRSEQNVYEMGGKLTNFLVISPSHFNP